SGPFDAAWPSSCRRASVPASIRCANTVSSALRSCRKRPTSVRSRCTRSWSSRIALEARAIGTPFSARDSRATQIEPAGLAAYATRSAVDLDSLACRPYRTSSAEAANGHLARAEKTPNPPKRCICLEPRGNRSRTRREQAVDEREPPREPTGRGITADAQVRSRCPPATRGVDSAQPVQKGRASRAGEAIKGGDL